jgi:hypothetical protein
MEQWKKINNFDNYEVSNYGNVRSLNYKQQGIIQILKPSVYKNYLKVSLFKESKCYTFRVHQLVAVAFLNHTICGMKKVINHIDFNTLNNNVSNLEVITHRQNANRKHLPSSSKYTGVSKYIYIGVNKTTIKWEASIKYKGKKIRLGYFNTEYDAHLAYEAKLKEININ